MNIHLTSKEEFEILKSLTYLTIPVGSKLYKMTNEKSDTDLLHIVLSSSNLHSFVWTHHQFQYKENNTDHIFCSLQNFVRNLLTGDSTINFEALHSDEVKNSTLGFLYNHRVHFASYQLIRSYLGLARRDLKMYNKDPDNKKLFHVQRGVLTAKTLMNQKEYSNNLQSLDEATSLILKSLKAETINEEDKKTLVKILSQEIDGLRDSLNLKYQNKEIHRMMAVTELSALDSEVRSWSEEGYREATAVVPDQFYESLYKNLEYDKA